MVRCPELSVSAKCDRRNFADTTLLFDGSLTR
jgi:hypothetical protein